jgi:hypothetical protein
MGTHKRLELRKGVSDLFIFLLSGWDRPYIQLSIRLRSISISIRLVKTNIPKFSGVEQQCLGCSADIFGKVKLRRK